MAFRQRYLLRPPHGSLRRRFAVEYLQSNFGLAHLANDYNHAKRLELGDYLWQVRVSLSLARHMLWQARDKSDRNR
jgi:hypothetical protein